MTKVVSKQLNKAAPEVAVAMEIYSRKCLEVVWVAHREDKHQRRERMFNIQLRLLLKKFIREKQLKSQLIVIEFARLAMEREVKMELIPPVPAAEAVEWSLKW